MALLTPDFIFKDVTHITPRFLAEQGVRALVLDVDNTLTTHGSQEVSDAVAHWLKRMAANGIPMMIGSNNVEDRVKPFAEKLGLEYAYFCCKPSPWWLMAAQKKWNLPKAQIALVGDQIFTDLLAGQLYGAKVFLVRPIARDTKASIRLKRKLESPFLMKYFDKGGKLL